MPLTLNQKLQEYLSKYQVDKLHVYYDDFDGNWSVDVETEDGPIPLKSYDTKKEAREKAYDAAENWAARGMGGKLKVEVWKRNNELQVQKVFK
jgi:hypothetical protein